MASGNEVDEISTLTRLIKLYQANRKFRVNIECDSDGLVENESQHAKFVAWARELHRIRLMVHNS